MSIDVDLPLAEIVNRAPGAARVLESYGLDYCCGGQRRLVDACRRSGLSVEAVREALAGARDGSVADWVGMDPVELVDHIEATHHRYLHRELPRLDALAVKVAAVHGGRHPELADVVADLKDLRDDLEPHLTKEERVLFPMIRGLVPGADGAAQLGGSVRAPISVMFAEHEAAGARLERLRDRTDGYSAPEDGCASYRALFDGLAELEADTHLHVHKENNLLFPAVLDLVGPAPDPERR